MDKLDRGSSVVVDKEFLIEDLCINYKINLIRSSFLRKETQFFTENAEIASAWVHVERLNQRLKVFEILGSKMSSCLISKSEKIVNILCAQEG